MKLHQLLAFERDVRKRANDVITGLLRDVAKADLFTGLHKTYTPKAEAGTKYPDERVPVTMRYQDALARFRAAWCDETNVVERKDIANRTAEAPVIVDGSTICGALPAPHLLFLEKQLEHVKTFVSAITELGTGYDWSADPMLGLQKSSPKLNHRMEKSIEPLVLYPATDKHPAQVQALQKDTIVGDWITTHYHGGISATEKREILARVAKLSDAVKEAREHANSATVPERGSAELFMQYIFEAS